MCRYATASAAVLATFLLAAAAEARCVKHTGFGSERDIAQSSANALAGWVADATKRGPGFAEWAKAKNMEVTCKKVVAGSGRARGPRWVCEASGSSTDVVGGENCPR